MSQHNSLPLIAVDRLQAVSNAVLRTEHGRLLAIGTMQIETATETELLRKSCSTDIRMEQIGVCCV